MRRRKGLKPGRLGEHPPINCEFASGEFGAKSVLCRLGAAAGRIVGDRAVLNHEAVSETWMRIAFTSDLHGREILYTQIDSLLRIEPADLLILGGDLWPDGDEAQPATQLQYVRDVFLPTIQRWRAQHPQLQVACIAGNHDWRGNVEALQAVAASERPVFLDGAAAWNFGGMAFIGFSHTPPTPHWLKDYERLDCEGDSVPDFPGWATNDGTGTVHRVTAQDHFKGLPTLEAELNRIVSPPAPWILVCHSPPYGGRLDRLPSVDHPVGSRAVAQFIAARRPVCALHGHIHESPEITGYFHDEVNGVACINPGQVGDRLHAVLFDPQRPLETLRHTVFG